MFFASHCGVTNGCYYSTHFATAFLGLVQQVHPVLIEYRRGSVSSRQFPGGSASPNVQWHGIKYSHIVRIRLGEEDEPRDTYLIFSESPPITSGDSLRSQPPVTTSSSVAPSAGTINVSQHFSGWAGNTGTPWSIGWIPWNFPNVPGAVGTSGCAPRPPSTQGSMLPSGVQSGPLPIGMGPSPVYYGRWDGASQSAPLPPGPSGTTSVGRSSIWPPISGYPYGSFGPWPMSASPLMPSHPTSSNLTIAPPPLSPKTIPVIPESGKTAPTESKGKAPVSRRMPTPLLDDSGKIGSPLLSQEEQNRLIEEIESQLLSWPSEEEDEAVEGEAVVRGCCSRLSSPHLPLGDPPVLPSGPDPLAIPSPLTSLPSSPIPRAQTPLPMGHLTPPPSSSLPHGHQTESESDGMEAINAALDAQKVLWAALRGSPETMAACLMGICDKSPECFLLRSIIVVFLIRPFRHPFYSKKLQLYLILVLIVDGWFSCIQKASSVLSSQGPEDVISGVVVPAEATRDLVGEGAEFL
ncbi:hypothetical protein BC826DRAFT_976188 [Russula brevipes]|nr:hypothetical protein BC826DRAFT_976188 [Russula brevipes]